MLDVDIRRLLGYCGVEPTPEAMEIVRRLASKGAIKPCAVPEYPCKMPERHAPPRILDTSATPPRIAVDASGMPPKIKQERKV